jgi:putative sterol carrier protein
VLGFLGGLAGMQDDMRLTSQRIQNLSLIDGTLLFELTGEHPLALLAHFGSSPIQDEPACTLRIDSTTYAQLRSGELPPQDAFMNGLVEIEGDMQMAMQLALAALSPD